MTLTALQLVCLVLGWLAYFVVHSVLASLSFKTWLLSKWPSLERLYRLLFNGFALVSLLPLLYMITAWRGESLWQWQDEWAWLANGLALVAVVGFFWTLKYYDGQEFLGFRQLQENRVSSSELTHFVISPAHRFVRHPWYFLALVLIWTRDMDLSLLVSSVLMTGYFWGGSWLEERKLVAQLGLSYERYLTRVSGLIPLPWKVLSAKEALELQGLGGSLNLMEKKPKK